MTEKSKTIRENNKSLGIAIIENSNNNTLNSKNILEKSSLKTISQNRLRPQQNYIDIMIACFNRSLYGNAEKLALVIARNYPSYQLIWKYLSAIYLATKRYEEGLNAVERAIKLDSKDAESQNNKGVILYKIGKFKNAEVCLKLALKLNSNYHDAYYNLGLVKKSMGRLNESIDLYRKALILKPDYVKAHNNLGNTLYNIGKIKEAMNSIYKAIEIQPNYIEAWNNIYFPFKLCSYLSECYKSSTLLTLKKKLSELDDIRFKLLEYKTYMGSEKAEFFFSQAINLFTKKESLKIQNPRLCKKNGKLNHKLPKKIISLVHFGRSGTGLFHSLVDSQSQIITLPSIYMSEFFDLTNWKNIISAGWEGMIDRFIRIYPVLFDSRSYHPVQSINMSSITGCGINEGMTELGKNKDEFLFVDKNIFKKELSIMMSEYTDINQPTFFKLIHLAFDKIINKNKTENKNVIFYHIHNPDACAKINFFRHFPEAQCVMMVRDPVTSCESWISTSFKEKNYNQISTRIKTMLFDIDDIVFQYSQSIGLRLEDLKNSPKQTIAAFCKWAGIREEKIMYSMTAQGKRWWGDKSSIHLPPFGKLPESKCGLVLTKNDRFILETLFYPFRVRFGYIEKNFKKFKIDLEIIRPMLDQVLDFEKKIADFKKINIEQFKTSGEFKYLHSILIERWNVLNKHNTYPGMLKPLKI